MLLASPPGLQKRAHVAGEAKKLPHGWLVEALGQSRTQRARRARGRDTEKADAGDRDGEAAPAIADNALADARQVRGHLNEPPLQFGAAAAMVTNKPSKLGDVGSKGPKDP